MAERRSNLAVVAIAVCALFAMAAATAAEQVLGTGKWVHEPLHSAMEAFGTVAALALGAISLMMRSYRGGSARGVWPGCGLIVMGILDGFHAAVHPGDLFVWLHSVSALAGGVLFALVWLPERSPDRAAPVVFPSAMAAAAVLLGAYSIAFPGSLPAMLAAGHFTPAARAINVLSGVLFLAAAARLFYGGGHEQHRHMFAILAVLFGAAGLMFEFSQAWQAGWWLWHVVRLAAYAAALLFVFVFYQQLLRQAIASIASISSTAAEIAATVEEHERTATQQAAAVNDTTATVEELGASAQQTESQAESAAVAAKQALDAAREGTALVDQVARSMGEMKHKVGSVAEQILRLSDKAAEIGGIAKVVGELAAETNMLALNAAVEAARAGEHGKGFAVVASEVRRLANQSKQSVERANALVGEIQKATDSAVMVTEKGTRTTEEVAALTQRTVQAFDAIAAAANSVSENAHQVLLNSKQQAGALGQVIGAMKGLSAGSRQTAAGTEQTKVGVLKLNSVAQDLKAMV